MNYLIGIVIFIGLLLTSRYYTKNKQKKIMMLRIRSQFGKIPDRDFIKENIQYLIKSETDEMDIDEITWNDLDMDKVYSRINNCNSFIGEQVLYKRLHLISDNHKNLKKREKMMQLFHENKDIREEIQFTLEKLGRRKISYYLPQFIHEIESFKMLNILLYRLMTSLLLCTTLLGMFVSKKFLYASVLIFLINAILYTSGKHRFEVHLEMLSTIVGVVTVANTLIKKYDFIEDELAKKSIQSSVRMSKAVKGIVFIQRKIETAMSGDIGALIFDYLIGSTLWDFHIFHKVISLLSENREGFMNLYSLIGEVDSAISICSYRKSIPHYYQAKFHKEKMIEFQDLYHPLVEKPIFNNVNMNSNYIITGSNASGKSTYIKAIGINMILAQSINTSLARIANIPFANVLTSMAVRDDVTSGESYYIREIKYLKRIISRLREDNLTICIVDEILRGTNTEERIAASVAILKYMNEKNCLAIVASHDIEISEMLSGQFKNCHFSEQMTDNDIYFDYKVKDGISRSKNAIKLLSYVGFPKEIVDYAEGIVVQN